jgi:hypothetical protein
MRQLLEDGETAEWIVGQVLPDGPEGTAQQLGRLLAELAAEVGPASLEPESEGSEDAAPTQEQPVPTAGVPTVVDWQEMARGMGLPLGVGIDQVSELMSSPRGALLADFGAFCEERGLGNEADQEVVSQAMQELQEEWLQTPREALEGRKPAEMLEGGRLFPAKVETFRREGPKVGRNDPCPCGSGRKFKKCCGKGE